MSTPAQRRKYRRKVLPGYPIEGKFENLKSVKEYFSGDTVTCLLCGKEYKLLSQHLRKTHSVDPDDYREKYGIPFTYGLCSEDFSLRSSAICKQTVTDRREEILEHLKECRKKCNQKKGRVSHAAIGTLKDRSKYTDGLIEAAKILFKKGFTLKEISSLLDIRYMQLRRRLK